MTKKKLKNRFQSNSVIFIIEIWLKYDKKYMAKMIKTKRNLTIKWKKVM